MGSFASVDWTVDGQLMSTSKGFGAFVTLERAITYNLHMSTAGDIPILNY